MSGKKRSEASTFSLLEIERAPDNVSAWSGRGRYGIPLAALRNLGEED